MCGELAKKISRCGEARCQEPFWEAAVLTEMQRGGMDRAGAAWVARICLEKKRGNSCCM